MRNYIGAVMMLCAMSALPANACIITASISDVQLGEHYFALSPDDSPSHKVGFTELTLELNGAYYCDEYQAGQQIKAGLCEEVDLHVGEYIRAYTGGWPGGPECIFRVKKLQRVTSF